MNGQRFTLTVTLLDDLHSGTGGSAGVIDAVQAVDRNGLPVLRATHLRGVLRAAAEELERLDAERYDGLADTLFGSNKHGKRGLVQLQSLYYQSDASSGAWSQIWTSSARGTDDDLLSRTARDDTLRVVEYVAAGSVFKGELLLRDAAWKEALELCVKRTQSLGGRRSRGDGLVQCLLAPSDPEPSAFSGKPTRALRLLLRNLDPLCLAITGSPGNIVPGEGYLRGQRLFGALADWALARPETEAALEDLWQGRVWVGDAYPLPAEIDDENVDLGACDVLPVPQFIGEPKTAISTAAGRLPHWASAAKAPRVLNADAKNRFKNNDRQLKRPKGYEFLCRLALGKAWRRYAPEIGVHMRNQIAGRELFSEQEIAEKTLFLAEVRFADEPAAERFKTCFGPLLVGNEWLALGRGGRPAKVERAAFVAISQTDGETAGKVAQLSVSLESDLIARVRRTDLGLPPLFGFYDRLTPVCLADLLQLPADGIEQCTWKVFSDTEEVRSFNAAGGLPTAPVLAIQRGSAVAIEAQDEAGQSFLAALRQALAAKCFEGLGERCEAGFGRFRIDFDPLDALGTSEETSNAAELPVSSAEQLCRQAAIFVEPLANKEKKPSRSQWRWFLSELRKTGTSASVVLDKVNAQSEKKGGEAWNSVKESLRAELGGCETEALKLQLAELIIRYLEKPKDRHD